MNDIKKLIIGPIILIFLTLIYIWFFIGTYKVFSMNNTRLKNLLVTFIVIWVINIIVSLFLRMYWLNVIFFIILLIIIWIIYNESKSIPKIQILFLSLAILYTIIFVIIVLVFIFKPEKITEIKFITII